MSGLKESKLGILAESKLTPSTGSVSVTTDKTAQESDDKKVPQTFNFAPLTKPTAEDALKEKTADEENKNPNLEDSKPAEKTDSSQFVFGQNLNERVENVSEEAGKVKNGDTEETEKTEKEEEEGPKVESQSEEKPKTDLLFTNSVSPSTKNGESQYDRVRDLAVIIAFLQTRRAPRVRVRLCTRRQPNTRRVTATRGSTRWWTS